MTFAMVRCMGKIKNACAISPAVRNEVLDRDGCKCIVCGANQNLQIAHFVPRSRLGLGIAKNLGTLCIHCHMQFDNGKKHNEIKPIFEEYLKSHYENWDEKDLVYKKWSWL